ncbi:MAG: hypothetical protein U9N81_03875, partial [Bacillota bacterium]|nr:hypothetical protein [Bacillota bacterium]
MSDIGLLTADFSDHRFEIINALDFLMTLDYQVFMEGPIKSPQRLPVRNIENQRRSDFFPARRCDNQAV